MRKIHGRIRNTMYNNNTTVMPRAVVGKVCAQKQQAGMELNGKSQGENQNPTCNNPWEEQPGNHSGEG